jgi:hypothetical protein
VEIIPSENGVTVWWRQPDFCDWNEILFGQDKNDLKPLPKTRLSHLDIPKKDIPFDVDNWVKIRGINKAGKGEWSEPKHIRITKAPSATLATKPNWFVAGWKRLTKVTPNLGTAANAEKAETKKKNAETTAKNIGVSEPPPSRQFEKAGWRKIVRWLPTAGMCLVVIGLIYWVAYGMVHNTRVLARKSLEQASITKSEITPTIKRESAEVMASLAAINGEIAKLAKEVANKPDKLDMKDALAKVAPASNAIDYNSMIVARKGDAMAQVPASSRSNIVVIIGDNNNPIINSAVVNAEQTQRPAHTVNKVPTRSQEQCPTAGHTYNEAPMFPAPDPYIGAYVDCRLTLNPGEYKEFVMPIRCHLDLYENNVHCIQFINGEPYVVPSNPYDLVVIRRYGLLNKSSWPVTVRIRLTRIGI